MEDSATILASRLPKRFRIVSPSGEEVQPRFLDLALGALHVDYPPVSSLLFHQPSEPQTDFSWKQPDTHRPHTVLALPWEMVVQADWVAGMITVNRVGAATPVETSSLQQNVLVLRDILDAYVVDIKDQRLTRANDLLLSSSQGLRLVAADIGLRALARRLTGGIYRRFEEGDLLDWKYVEFLRGEPEAVHRGAGYLRRIERLPPGEIAELAGSLPYLHAAELILLLPHQLAADSMELMSPERQLQVFEELDEGTAAAILQQMAPDISADLLRRLRVERAKHYLDRLPRTASDRIVDLLRFPEDSVGGIMTNDVIAIPGALTIAEARPRLQEALHGPDFVYFVYVIDSDEDRRLKGVVTLRSILVAREDQRLDEIMNPYLEKLAPLENARVAAHTLIRSQLAALPVVTPAGKLLGAVTIDTAVRLVAPQSWSTQAPRVFS